MIAKLFPPLDAEHVPIYAAVAVIATLLLWLDSAFKRREYRRKAELVRLALKNQQCPHCSAALWEWDGRFLKGDVHFNPGSYLPKVTTCCTACGTNNHFYFSEASAGNSCLFNWGRFMKDVAEHESDASSA